MAYRIRPLNLVTDFGSLGALLAASLVFIVLAVIFFKRLEPNFAKVL